MYIDENRRLMGSRKTDKVSIYIHTHCFNSSIFLIDFISKCSSEGFFDRSLQEVTKLVLDPLEDLAGENTLFSSRLLSCHTRTFAI